MKNFSADFSHVKKIIDKDTIRLPVHENKHRMIRVAFDVFRLKNNDPEELWQVQSNEDGEFLVRTYSLPEDEKVNPDWKVQEDSKKANLTISYKTIPVTRIAMKDYGIKTDRDSSIFQRALLKKLSSDDKFVDNVMSTLSTNKQNLLKEAGLVKKIDSRLLELEKKLQNN